MSVIQRTIRYVIALGLFAGCSSTFEPRLNAFDLGKSGLPEARAIHAGVEVSIEEFASAQKSRRAFDAEVAPRGVLPILVRIENNSDANYVVQRKQITALANGQRLGPLQGFEAAELGASRNATWNALVNTAALGPLAMFFWPATMAGAASQTQKINRQIERHFESIELADTIVKPGEKVTGFVFYRIPGGAITWDTTRVKIVLLPKPVGELPQQPLRFELLLSSIETDDAEPYSPLRGRGQ